MKKIISLIIIALFSFLRSHSQSLQFFGFGISKGMQKDGYSTIYNNALDPYDYEVNYEPYKIGSGTNLFYRVLPQHKTNIALGFEVGYQNGKNVFEENNFIQFDEGGNEVLVKYKGDFNINYLYITPLLYFKTEINNNWLFYACIGPKIARPKRTVEQIFYWPTGDVRENTWESNKKWSLGSQTVIGIQKNSEAKIKWFAEISITTLNYTPTYDKLTNAEWNGKSFLSEIPYDEKVFEFNTTSSETEGLKYIFNLSAIAFNTGFTITLPSQSSLEE